MRPQDASPGSRLPGRGRATARRWRSLAHGTARIGLLLAILCSLLGPSMPAAVARAAAVCSGWASEAAPPPTINVLRTSGPASGTVQTVPFHDYVTTVMAAEWGPSSPQEALRAGAVAVKEYAWYYAMVWRGGTSGGSCYDVVDNTNDQIYAPETRAAAPSEVAAVDATWGMTVLKPDHLFATHYRGGSSVACGANANGTNLYQVSAMDCARNGMLAAQILETYYGPGVAIVGATTAAAPGTASAVVFGTQPGGGPAGAPFAAQPSVRIVDSTGQTVTAGPGSTEVVTLALGSNPGDASLTCAGGPSRPAVTGVATFDGCTISAVGSGYVLVASANGLVPATSSPFAVTAAPAVVTMVAPSVVPWGTGVTLAIRLEPPPGGGTVGGRPMHLQVSADGATWSGLAELTTDPLGTATYAYRPASNRYYRAVFDGAPDLGAATGAARRIVVRQIALLRPDNRGVVRTVPRGTGVTFTTLVRPVAPAGIAARVRYELYQRVGRSWVLRRTATVAADAAGRTSYPVTFGTAGSWYLRSMALPTPANANSAWSPVQRYDVR